jgi:molecular chaperone GrpE
MADERVKRAEELLKERTRGTKTVPNEPAEMVSQDERDALSAGEDAERQKAELIRDLQRLAADFANYRRRNESERADFVRFAKADLITRLLEVLDDYDRALGTVPEDARSQPWVEGMWLVERKLRDMLMSEGLEPIETVGKPFDPYVHESIAHVDADAPEETVVDEVRKGYRLHDRVIRPALVTVAKQKES